MDIIFTRKNGNNRISFPKQVNNKSVSPGKNSIVVNYFDTFHVLKEKIYAVSGVPVECQHIYIKDGDLMGYDYNYSNITISRKDIFTRKDPTMEYYNNIELDNYLLKVKEDLIIYNKDFTSTVELINSSVHVLVLDDFIEDVKEELKSNSQILNLVYHGFIVKFFPYFTLGKFIQYINGSMELQDQKRLLKKYKLQTKLLDNRKFSPEKNTLITGCSYTHHSFDSSMYLDKFITIHVYFNTLKCSDVIPVMYYNNGKYTMKKSLYNYKTIDSVDVPAYTLCIKFIFEGDEHCYIFISSSGYDIYSHWDIYKRRSIKNILDMLLGLNDPIFNILSLISLNSLNLKLVEVNTYTYLKKVISPKNLKLLQEKYKDMVDVDIFQRQYSQYPNIRKSLMIAGVSEVNIKDYVNILPPTSNYFSIYNNEELKLLHDNVMYGKKKVSIYFELNNIKIIIKNITLKGWNVAKFIIECFLSELKASKGVKSDIIDIQNMDPVLYNTTSTYSRLCQSIKRPIIVDEGGIPYKNFTTNKIVQYKCPNKKYPNLGFITNYHEKNYCVPCCYIKDSTKNKNYKTCLKDYVNVDSSDSTKLTYLVQYKSILRELSVSYLPDSIYQLLNVNRGFYCLSVFKNPSAVLSIISLSLNKAVDEVIDLIIDRVENTSISLWKNLMYTNSFRSRSEFLQKFKNKFVNIQICYFTQWEELIVDLASIYLNIEIIIVRVSENKLMWNYICSRDGSPTDSCKIKSLSEDSKIIFALQDEYINPIVKLDFLNYKKTYEIDQINFTVNDDIVKNLLSAINAGENPELSSIQSSSDESLKNVTKQYVRNSTAYGVIKDGVYQPIPYRTPFKDIPVDYSNPSNFKPFKSSYLNYTCLVYKSIKTNKLIVLGYYDSNHLLHYVKPYEIKELPYTYKLVFYNIHEILKEDVVETKPKSIDKLLEKKYSYYLFILDFIQKYVYVLRNDKLRKDPDLLNKISAKDKDRIIQMKEVDDDQYEFDRAEYKALIDKKDKNLKPEIEAICKKYKIDIPKKSYIKYLEYDIKNQKYLQYVERKQVLDFYDFNLEKNEVITII
jgi:hypothetical protein